MKTSTLLRAQLLLLQLVLLSLLLAGPAASCIASLGSPVWWATLSDRLPLADAELFSCSHDGLLVAG